MGCALHTDMSCAEAVHSGEGPDAEQGRAFLSLAANRLGVRPADLPAVLDFYSEALGMQVVGSTAGFGPLELARQGSVALEFLPCDGADRMSASGYWKIGVGLPDVNAAVKRLRAKGVDVRPASQFLDVGFLTHLQDTAGYTIELLQDTFETNFQPSAEGPLPGPLACERPKVGQITLRVADIGQSLTFYRDVLGMRLLCNYPVGKYGFELYFLAFTDEEPADADPLALVNREWTYSRPYTTLELQVVPGKKQKHTAPAPGEVGWQGLVLGVASEASATARLAEYRIPARTAEDGQTLEVRDPDGYRLYLRTAQANL